MTYWLLQIYSTAAHARLICRPEQWCCVAYMYSNLCKRSAQNLSSSECQLGGTTFRSNWKQNTLQDWPQQSAQLYQAPSRIIIQMLHELQIYILLYWWMVLPISYRLTQVVLEKRQLNGCSSSSSSLPTARSDPFAICLAANTSSSTNKISSKWLVCSRQLPNNCHKPKFSIAMDSADRLYQRWLLWRWCRSAGRVLHAHPPALSVQQTEDTRWPRSLAPSASGSWYLSDLAGMCPRGGVGCVSGRSTSVWLSVWMAMLESHRNHPVAQITYISNLQISMANWNWWQMTT